MLRGVTVGTGKSGAARRDTDVQEAEQRQGGGHGPLLSPV